MSTTTITRGKDFTAISFDRPISEFTKYVYNGADTLAALDCPDSARFWDKGQTIDIYDGKQMLYSINVSELKYKRRWRKIVTTVYNRNGLVYDGTEFYKQLLAEV